MNRCRRNAVWAGPSMTARGQLLSDVFRAVERGHALRHRESSDAQVLRDGSRRRRDESSRPHCERRHGTADRRQRRADSRRERAASSGVSSSFRDVSERRQAELALRAKRTRAGRFLRKRLALRCTGSDRMASSCGRTRPSSTCWGIRGKSTSAATSRSSTSIGT